MNDKNSKPTTVASDSAETAFRHLFEAASADVEDATPPPFFAARVRARAIAERRARRATEHALGVAAWRLLPILGVLAVVVAGWSGYETVQYRRERDRAVARVLAEGGGDVIVAFVMLGADTGGSR